MRFWPVAILATCLATPALALDCKNAIKQADMNACAVQAFKAADAALNAVYGQLVARLDHADSANDMTLLTAAQRSWVAFRDAECAFRTSGSEGGSIHPMDLLGCREQLTTKRTDELKAYMSCKVEDGDCPAPAPAP